MFSPSFFILYRAIYTLLLIRKYRAGLCILGNIAKDVVLIICKHLFKTRKDKAWMDEKDLARTQYLLEKGEKEKLKNLGLF